ncbi:hypothetical protein IMCC3317_10980 [Kordia antarctica]|uniref:Uncharacterized protein n=1 Tax=Kordia antarctica TaxID=1218801 RepID=A0A7L4ZGV7_9FLAO|nr:hypothetical protein [Kordia antarctica]QHI35750.1 hypothetical protein IMCC3317_10980 [Kordia antarctica]
MNKAEGTISAIAITESTILNLKELNGRGVYHLTIRNRGNVTAMLNGIDDVKPDEVFVVEVPFAVVNTSFRIDFVQTEQETPNPRLVLWYGTLACQ